VLGLAGAFDLGLDAPPRPVGFDQTRMDAVDLHAVGLAAIGEAFGEGRDRGVDRTADGELRRRLARAGAADRNERAVPLLSSGQAARASRIWPKNFSA